MCAVRFGNMLLIALAFAGIPMANDAIQVLIAVLVTMPRTVHEAAWHTALLRNACASTPAVAAITDVVRECSRNGWLTVVDSTLLHRMRQRVSGLHILGPLQGYPPIGTIGVSFAGLEALQSDIGDRLPIQAMYSLASSVHREIEEEVSVTLSRAEASITDARAAGCKILSGPTQIDSWRAPWWDLHQCGFLYSVLSDYDPVMERSSSLVDLSSFPAAAARWRLARWLDVVCVGDISAVLIAFGLSLTEFAVLLTVGMSEAERDLDRIAFAATENARREFQMNISRDDALRGIRRCSERGYLMECDQRMCEDIAARCLASSVIDWALSLPSAGDIILTETGAEYVQRVREAVTEGRWQDTVQFSRLSRVTTREYFDNWDDAVAGREKLLKLPDVSAVTEPVAIGPWCRYWTEWFARGYTVDVDSGTRYS